jgi:hypothetical protein
MLNVNWVDSEADIPPDLWVRCFPPQVEGHWWYRILEHCGIQDQFRFIYGVVYGPSGPLAIAPVFLMDVPIRLVLPPVLLPLANLLSKLCPSLLFQRTLFIGSPCSDEGTVGMLPDVNSLDIFRCVQLAAERLAEQLKAPLLVWKDFPSSCDPILSVLARERGLFPLASFPGTLVNLPGNSWDAYLASLKATRRNKLKKKLRRAAEAPLFSEVIQQPSTHALDELYDLFWQTYEKGQTKFERLNRRFFDLASEQPHAHFILLREQASGRLMAFMLCFQQDGHVINKYIGLDYSQPKEWFLYFRLWQAAVSWAASIGAKTIQSGQTGYAPKIELGHALVPLTNYCRHRNRVIHWIFAQVAKTIEWGTLDADLAIYLRAHPEEK